MTHSTDPFESPKLLMKGVLTDIDRLIAAQDEFQSSCKWVRADEINPVNENTISKVRLIQPSLDPMRLIVYRIVNDFRNALDQAMWASAKLLGATGDKIYFPFASNPADLDGGYGPKGHYRDIPPEIRPFILSLKPYSSTEKHGPGDDFLKWLSTISGPNKHRMMLKLSVDHSGTSIQYFGISAGSAIFEWDEARSEFTIAEIPPGHAADWRGMKLSLIVGFANAPEALLGMSAITVLKQLATKVNSIIVGLEAETARVMKDRSR